MFDFEVKEISENPGYFDFDPAMEKTEGFAQRLALMLNTWKKEFPYNTDRGIDYEAILSGSVSARSLEAFFVYSLREQLGDFDRLDSFTLEHDRATGSVKVGFRAFSKSGDEILIPAYAI